MQKRRCEEFVALPELGPKRAKIRDLESVLRSEGKSFGYFQFEEFDSIKWFLKV